MVPNKEKAAVAPKRAKPCKTGGVQKQRRVNRKNALLADGVRRFKKDRIAARKEDFSLKSLKMVRTKKPKVLVKKYMSYLPNKSLIRKQSAKRCFRNHKRYIHKTLKKVKVMILLAGRHKGKRIVLLIPGSRNYVIVTKPRVDLRKAKISKHINDEYFRWACKKKTCTEEELFAEKEVKYVPSEQRKADQKSMDEEVLKAIKAHPEDKVIRRYFKTMFSMPT
ncbi:hypothetical protein pipiens_007640 [Culex pipiens pipiens]|uniref:60S ribosomal protein L6 n=1 Tax=Culex pipiens pipiens TaxID=38569 RepID=A0ABD1DKV6_CULPP